MLPTFIRRIYISRFVHGLLLHQRSHLCSVRKFSPFMPFGSKRIWRLDKISLLSTFHDHFSRQMSKNSCCKGCIHFLMHPGSRLEHMFRKPSSCSQKHTTGKVQDATSWGHIFIFPLFFIRNKLSTSTTQKWFIDFCLSLKNCYSFSQHSLDYFLLL